MQIDIRVIVYRPGEPGQVMDVPNTLKALQELVGGFVEVLVDANVGIQMYVNEDGRLQALPPNCRFGAYDVLGTAVFCRHDDDGDAAGLSDDDVDVIRALYG